MSFPHIQIIREDKTFKFSLTNFCKIDVCKTTFVKNFLKRFKRNIQVVKEAILTV